MSAPIENPDEYISATEAAETIEIDPNQANDDQMDDSDAEMSDEEITLQNDSVTYFSKHSDSIFCIAAHPTESNIVATGGGDDLAWVFDVTGERESGEADDDDGGLKPVSKLEKHTDSVTDIAFSIPDGRFIVTAGMDGRVAVWSRQANGGYAFSSDIVEVEEVSWLSVCPSASHPNSFAFGASDGSVWVYQISDAGSLEQIATYFPSDPAPSTAGTFSPQSAPASLLATVSEDSRVCVYDPFGDAAAAGITNHGQQALYASDPADERYRVEGGLYSVTISPTNGVVAVGGAEGQIRVIGLPRKTTAGGSLVASIAVQTDSVETLAFVPAPTVKGVQPIPLLAAGSVDGSIAVFDVSRNYGLRRHITDAHADEDGGQAVIKIQFAAPTAAQPALLTSCGNDGVVRRWDMRGTNVAPPGTLAGRVPANMATGFKTVTTGNTGAASATATDRSANPPLREWRGHRGGGEGGGVMGFVTGIGKNDGFVQSEDAEEGVEGGWIVTAGDDGVSLVFLT